ncbi:kinase-like domain-containing protein [Lactarius indigo]|nr:kinase-like domain-containing protein [Lactarius indigo]
MDPAGLQVMNSRLPFDPTADVRITHTVHQGRATDHQTRGLILNHYLRGASVGQGQHGTVYKCYDLTRNNLEVAIKVVSRHNPRDRLNQLRRNKIPRSGPHLPVTDNLGSQEYKIKKEIAIMKLCRHPHVVRLLEVIDDKLYQKVYMVMEFLGGGEIKWRDSENNPVLRVDQSRRICRDVILGLEYLHFQGIIHRDIKPANLMWTSDRRTVKITDFGVAHISAAQRFAGSGRYHPATGAMTMAESDNDLQLLFDDSELCKTAGTPSFLAPEVVYDFGSEIPPLPSSEVLAIRDSNSATTLHPSSPPPPHHRPPITKAIDVWAFGVTLYCLLFGRTPFRVESNQEFALYGVIRTQDWDVPQFMGLDHIPTKGRHHDCLDDGPCSEGAEIIKLLERLLEKDMNKRITLDEVKRHRWFLRDIPDRERWVRETLPDSKVVTTITEDAISDAVSPIRFRWRQRLTNRLTSFLRTVRPKRSFRSADGHSDSDDVGVRSLPTVRINRFSTRNDTSRRTGVPQPNNSQTRSHPVQSSSRSLREVPTSHTRSDTHHRQMPSSSRSLTHRSVVDISSPPRSKSSDTRPQASSSGNAPHANKSLEKRRGSVSHLVPTDRHAASLHSNATTPDEPRPRSRFSLSSLRWRRGDPPASTPASATTSTPATPPMPSREPSGHQPGPEPAPAAPVLVETDGAPAMRASSWGDVGEYGRLLRAQEAASMHSGAGEHDEPLDLDVVVVGAGGVANGPLPPTPSGSAGVLAALASLEPYNISVDAMVLPHPPLSPVVDALLGGRGNPHAARSIMQVSSYGSGFGSGGDVGGDDGDGDGSDGDSDSFFARNSEEAARGAFSRHHLLPHAPCRGGDDGEDDDDDDVDAGWGFGGGVSTTQCAVERARARVATYGANLGVGGEEEESDDDDDDEGSDEMPIEVRRRRPSWAVHRDEHEGDDEDEDDGPPPSPPPPLHEGDSGGDEP